MKKFISFVLTILILIQMVPSVIARLSDMIGINEQLAGYFIKLLFVFVLIIFFIISAAAYSNEFTLNNLKISVSGFLYFIVLIIVLVITSRINSQPVSWRMSGYFILIVVMALSIFKYNRFTLSLSAMYWGIVVYTVPNALLGIVQYITGQSIVPIVNQNGDASVASTQLNDVSSLGILGSNGGYRAFGLFDSGMTLGLFLLLGLAVLFFGKLKINRYAKLPLGTLFIIALIMTLTRNIYFLFVLLMFLRFVNSNKMKNILFIVGIIMQAVTVEIANVLNTLTFFQSAFFGTLRARFRGLIFFENYYQQNIVSYLFGKGYQYDAIVKSFTENTVDNQMLATFLDIGIIGLVVVYLYFWKSMRSMYQPVSLVLQNMLVIFSFFGIANNHIVFFSGILLLMLLSKDSQFLKVEKIKRKTNG
ncbi:hypothetical protein CS304_10295 [Lactiplantibacillus plantarum]|uniref:hypothetical protein n=1 Tax=Lactiplantibacillus plantarum TaxID=1590 RepID=UPI00019F522E|nr:hypothetical protein [Lactiplantibacillus plantarum]AXQ27051.1 hypothetical protein D0Y51_15430 [Lactiplantibacillus plantarum]EFK29264.1 hypothetical protein HMPREF0531_11701 [Lactiplantibacillus plantarum subsp. plantarum ATCC 14917 = JCM 1149 = CGMCC 1.2437]KPN85286.1 hypothetical protein Nizo2877_2224 [Lactiplantibacillus plantarum]KRL33289.1 brp Blh family beta-carotene 15,15-monooxygenase [Lactiplantibacillus plantarum subsp. plantarum ATCC 14917 = JCM 1149 = CGMCC 1.2437]KZU70105.1 h